MGGGGGGGMSASEQRYYQQQQLEIAQQQLEIAKAQAINSAVEPEKKVDSAKKASADTAKANELRRGLSSAFSRDSVGKTATGGSATGGQSAKLGG